jgi:large subunit ribosomal protein L30
MENVKVTLVKSLIACKPAQIATAKTLGLKRPGDFIVTANNAALMGKIKVISHLVKVETV